MILGDDDLSCFLREARGRRFAWGSFDCLMWLAEWIAKRRGVDPGEGWRGSYRNEGEALQVTKRAGGIVQHVENCVRPFGIVRTSDPVRGDIAVIKDAVGGMGAIVMAPPNGDRGTVVCLAEGGLVVRRIAGAPILAAWSV